MYRRGIFGKGVFAITLLAGLALGASAQAEDYVITIKDHQFSPTKLTVPAGQRIQLVVKNEQSTTAEFESAELNREKVVEAGSSITVNLGPLDAGDYPYFDDFHRETTGVITAK